MTGGLELSLRIALAVAFAINASCGTMGGVSTADARAKECRTYDAETAAIQWVLADEDDGPVLDSWCAGVGPPVMETSPTAGSRVEIDSLLVVTWNIRVGGGDLIRFVDDLRSGRLTGEPVEHFVLLLQEAHRSGSEVPPAVDAGSVPRRIESVPESGERIDIVEAARRMRLNLLYIPSMRNGFSPRTAPEDRGNAIMATLPLSAPIAIELPYEAQRRVTAVAEVRGVTSDASRWVLHVASTHLDTRSRWSRILASFGAGRLRQARGLVLALPLDRPTVIGADLNTWSARALEKVVPFLKEHFPETPRNQRKPTYTLGRIMGWRLDHLLFRMPPAYEAEVHRVDSRYGSDHYPILGWIRFGSAPAQP